MLEQGLIDVLWSLAPNMVVGTALILAGVWIGWRAAGRRSFPPVRLIAWWVGRVALPLAGAGSWWRRSAGIFLNNASVCACVVAAGAWAPGAWMTVAGVGIALGMGFRVLMGRDCDAHFTASSARDRRLPIGIALNMLEPPAIALSAALSLGQRAMPVGISWTASLRLFALLAIPALALAAGGEGLWLGAVHRGDTEPDLCGRSGPRTDTKSVDGARDAGRNQ